MKDFASKLNLYETLSMLIPGSTLLFVLSSKYENRIVFYHLLDFSKAGIDETVARATIFLVLAYFTGLFHHSLMNWVFSGLRNNKRMIEYSLRKLETKTQYKNLDKVFGGAYKIETPTNSAWYDCPIIALLVQGLNVIWSSLRNMLQMKGCKSSTLTDRYNDAYYYVFSKNWGGSIGHIERQVMGIRNMLIPLTSLLFIMKSPSCARITCALIFIFALYLLMIERQNKVYNSVFENYEYLKRLDNKEGNASTKE